MSEMVERVMRALTEVIADRVPNNRSALDAVGCSYEMARAAIAAMREPTEGMVGAANQAVDDGAGCAITTWHAMIDAALGETR